LAPGEPIAPLDPAIAAHLGLNPACIVRAGTTDSIAAFMAAGADKPGEAVTSLGTTLVLKLLSETRLEDPASGVYSHRFGRLWLAGGASNSGGGVLKRYFSDADLQRLSAQIDPARSSGFDYYPLPCPGERFPVNDPELAPRMQPRPDNDAAFLHGLLEGIAAIEARGYRRLVELGASPLKKLLTAGGGARNPVWCEIRQSLLRVPVVAATYTEAAYGAARLARYGTGLMPA
jgi:sugar (pentulose or hexulose) kinase